MIIFPATVIHGRQKYGGGRVASRKRRSHKNNSKRGYLKEINHLIQKLIKVREDINKLTIPEKPKKMKVTGYNACN